MTEYVKQTVSKALLSKNNLNTDCILQANQMIGWWLQCLLPTLMNLLTTVLPCWIIFAL